MTINKKIIITALWGNIMGFLVMRFLGKAYDAIPSFKQSGVDEFVSLVIFYLVMGAPGAYFYAKKIESSNKDVNIWDLSIEIFGVGIAAFFLGIIGVIMGRI
ncbi:MAG: hypothetical protein D4R93_00880 [Deltaproteobacteria bacterium]|nr:MAG: hypothetical protein D4R93_00880 [Deltaproteobacteria bacterium]